MSTDEIRLETIQKTQKILGKYIKKPPLTEKLLKKPPFRFLHDIITTLIRETGFLNGLFTDEELISDNVKERDSKLAFLTKLIDAIKIITNTNLSTRPSKIIAGLEPTETNILLQTIGKAIHNKIDSKEYIKQLHSGQLDKKKIKKSQEKSKNPPTTDRKVKEKIVKEINLKKKSSPETKEAKLNEKIKNKKDKNQNDLNEVENKLIEQTVLDNSKINETIEQSDIVKTEAELPKRPISAVRPKSARPKSGNDPQSLNNEKIKIEENNSLILNKNIDQSSSEIQLKKEINVDKIKEYRPKTSLRPPSVRPSSARPGAPRLRPDSALPIKETVNFGQIKVIVENFDKNKDNDDEETVIIQNNIENFDDAPYENLDDLGENKGHLVEQILEQIQQSGNEDELKVKTEIDWQNSLTNSTNTTNSKDIHGLRSLIQNLTKTANPLGKLLNYLHEDIEAMHNELEYWTNTKKQLFSDIQKQKIISDELNKPLLEKLENLNQEIRKQEDEIIVMRNVILRNEERIQELVIKK